MNSMHTPVCPVQNSELFYPGQLNNMTRMYDQVSSEDMLHFYIDFYIPKYFRSVWMYLWPNYGYNICMTNESILIMYLYQEICWPETFDPNKLTRWVVIRFGCKECLNTAIVQAKHISILTSLHFRVSTGLMERLCYSIYGELLHFSFSVRHQPTFSHQVSDTVF